MLTRFLLIPLTILVINHNLLAQPGHTLEWSELPPVPDPMGFNGSFTGVHNDALIVVGGANFPQEPVHEGGRKKYYREIFVLESDGDNFQWHSGFEYPNEVAYGASVSTDRGLVCIGGRGSERAYNDVNLLIWDNSSKTVEIEKWPSLPFSMYNMAAARVDNVIYVAGGIAGEELVNRFLSLDLNQRGEVDFDWKELPEFPGPARLMPVAVAQNAEEETHLFLFSGSSYPVDEQEPSVNSDGLEYNPKKREWTAIAEISPKQKGPFSLHGASGISVGAHHILFVGGVNHQIFTNAWKRERQISLAEQQRDSAQLDILRREQHNYFLNDPDWYNFNKEILLYHTITDNWTIVDHVPFQSVAGGGLVKWKGGWAVVGGEIKPGVRTSKVYFGNYDYDPMFGWVNWTVLVLYMLAMLYLGYFFLKREGSTDDFFKGGQRIPWWAAGMSIFATMLSAITFMAIPAVTYARDWRYYPMAVTILIMAFPVIRYYLPFFRRLKVTTAYEYLQHRFNYTARLLASVLFIIFMVARMALVLFLPSLALTTVTGIDIYTCIIMMGLITIVYCTMGGVEAVIWGDVIQGFVLMGGAVLSVVFLINGTEGGVSKIIDTTIEYDKMRVFDLALSLNNPTFWVILLGGMALNLITYSSDQAIIQRYLTTKDEKAARGSILLNGILSVVISLVFYFIGTAMFAYYKTQPDQLHFTMENPDSIFPYFIMTNLPVGIAGLLIAAIFAATMSTVSTNINSLSTAFTVDIYHKLFPQSSDKRRLWIARLSGSIFGAIGVALALLMATWNILSLFDFFNYILGLLSSGVAGLFLMGIFFPRIKSRAAISGFLGGTFILILVSTNTEVHGYLYGLTGLIASLLVGLIASFIITEEDKPLPGLTVRTMNQEQA